MGTRVQGWARETIGALGAVALVVVAAGCSSTTTARPAILTTSTSAASAISCPSEVEVVIAVAPVAAGTPVADAVANGSLVRIWMQQKYTPGDVVPVDAVAGTVAVPMAVPSVLLSTALAPGGEPVPIAPATTCWSRDSAPASVLVAREPVPAGTTLAAAIDQLLVVPAEIQVGLLPADILFGDEPVAALVDVPAYTVITRTTFG